MEIGRVVFILNRGLVDPVTKKSSISIQVQYIDMKEVHQKETLILVDAMAQHISKLIRLTLESAGTSLNYGGPK